MTSSPSPPVALTMGEPAGIGGELTLMAWKQRRVQGLPAFYAIDDPDRLDKLARTLGWHLPIRVLNSPEEAHLHFDHALPVWPLALSASVQAGHPDVRNARIVIESIDRAAASVLEGQAAGIVTNPVHKPILQNAGFHAPGQTEYLARLTGASHKPVMMLVSPELRVVPVTVHIPLSEVSGRLDQDTIVHAGRITAQALTQDIGIRSPHLAVAGLNPHAGDGGMFGREEIEIISPAIATLRGENIRVTGPFPADTLFHPAARKSYDAVLCMYHDQALIPLKTLDFEHGVNVTLGLSIVRTSPDHGTAFDIAGTGRASPASLIAALKTAAEIAARRAD